MSALSACFTVHDMVHVEARRVIKFSEPGDPDNCELLCVCWELDFSPLKEQSVLLHTK